MRTRLVLPAFALVVLAAVLGGPVPRAQAETVEGPPPITVDGVDYRYAPLDGSQWLERRDADGWAPLAPAASGTHDLVAFHGDLFAVSAGAVTRLEAGALQVVAGAPGSVTALVVFDGDLYAADDAGWAESADGSDWTTVPDAPVGTTEPTEYAGALYFDGSPAPGADSVFMRFDGTTFTELPGGPVGVVAAAVADGVLYYRDAGRTHLASLGSFDGTGFTVLNDSTYLPIFVGPVVVHGHVYVGTVQDPGTIVSLRVSDGRFIQQDGSVTGFSDLASADGLLWYEDSPTTGSTAVWHTWRESLPTLPDDAVTLTGDLVFGSRLAAVTTGWPAGTTFTYRWERDRRTVPGETAPTHVVQEADLGHHLEVEVTASTAEYVPDVTTITATSDPVAMAATFTRASAPVIRGTMRANHLLHADVPAWLPAASHHLFQWRRDGRNIAGATHATYRLIGRDRGHAITVRVVGSRPGYVYSIATSRARRVAR